MTRTYQPVTVTSLLQDPFFKKICPKNFNRGILERELADTRVMKLDLDELAKASPEDLEALPLFHGTAEKKEPGAPAREEERETEWSDDDFSLGSRAATVLIGSQEAEAKIILNEPAYDAPPPTEAVIRQALTDAGVVHGIRDEFVTRLAERPIYGRRFKIAEGSAPVDGEDGKVIFYFDTKAELSPRVGEGGLVDYKSLDYAKNVKKGDLLCEIFPPTQGADGVSVRGEILPGKPGTPAEITAGSNTAASEDGRQIRAACDGQVRLKGTKVSVSRVLTVDRVDGSTGNILFVGSVQINGDVAGGFTVRAGGDIMVRGVVENATLISGGNIVLCSGITGNDGGMLDAAGSIRTLFIENAQVKAKENIYADAIINSTVECGQVVSLSGENGCLRGGKCVAGKSIQARYIGNEANLATSVCLRDTETPASRKSRAQTKAARYQETIERLKAMALHASEEGRYDLQYQAMLARVLITKQRLEHAIRDVKAKAAENTGPSVTRTAVVRGTLYPNVTVEIDGEVLRNNKCHTACALVRSGNHVAVTSARYYAI